MLLQFNNPCYKKEKIRLAIRLLIHVTYLGTFKFTTTTIFLAKLVDFFRQCLVSGMRAWKGQFERLPTRVRM